VNKTKTSSLVTPHNQGYNILLRKKCLSLALCRKSKKYFGENNYPCSFKGNFHVKKKVDQL
jgi:hypothetical protein